jgi:hypothetical protein
MIGKVLDYRHVPENLRGFLWVFHTVDKFEMPDIIPV